jgi:hypothetical protein
MMFLAITVLALIAGCESAVLDTTSMVNGSALFGSVATFTCSISGSQVIGETLSFSKITNGVTGLISSDLNAANTTKHSVAGTYVLSINDAVWTDEGQYQCNLGIAAATAYLTVGVAPTEGFLYWGNNQTWTKKGEAANLTCESGTSRPPATFRWFRGATEVITGILNPTSSVDASGYGTAMSMIEMTPDTVDEGIVYKCEIDVAGKDSVLSETLAVSFSGAASIMASMFLVMATAVVASFRV